MKLVPFFLLVLTNCDDELFAPDLYEHGQTLYFDVSDGDNVNVIIYDDYMIAYGDVIFGKLGSDELKLLSDDVDKGVSKHIPSLMNVEVIGGIWDCPIPYVISYGDLREEIELAIEHWEDRTPWRFEERTTQTGFIDFVNGIGGGCASYVGRTGVRQEITLSRQCSMGSIVHEIGHAIGFYHEHQRIDRDRYVNILYDNIKEGASSNFFPLSTTQARDVEAYDYGSIMHYSTQAFQAAINLETIEPTRQVDDGVIIGQRDGLSEIDIASAVDRYNRARIRCTSTDTSSPKECRGTNDDSCCTPDDPCGEGQGDCDSDDECAGDLECPNDDNCEAIWGASAEKQDCCVKPPVSDSDSGSDSDSDSDPTPPGCNGSEYDCCTIENPCGNMGGDCDSHDECLPGLRCSGNSCRDFHGNVAHGDADCCVLKVCEGTSDDSCCTVDDPCEEGQGDCDSDGECIGDLECPNNDNCDTIWGPNASSQDCCVKPVDTITTSDDTCNGTEDNDCCTPENPCDEGGGDCDSNNECSGDLICPDTDNCEYYHGSSVETPFEDCCRPECRGTPDDNCCREDNKCEEGEGDCDSDDECFGDFICPDIDNCATMWTAINGDEDCCMRPPCDVEIYGRVDANLILNGIYEWVGDFFNDRPYYLLHNSDPEIYLYYYEPLSMWYVNAGSDSAIAEDVSVTADKISTVWYVIESGSVYLRDDNINIRCAS